MKKPLPQNYPDFFQKYINQVKEENLKPAFKNQMPAAELFFKSISNEFSNRRYAESKWTIKEVLQHIIDAERVFAYRALCIARKEPNVLLLLMKIIMPSILMLKVETGRTSLMNLLSYGDQQNTFLIAYQMKRSIPWGR